jgi:hypothetical protein
VSNKDDGVGLTKHCKRKGGIVLQNKHARFDHRSAYVPARPPPIRLFSPDSPFSGSNLPPFSIASLKELTWRLKLPSSEAQLGLKSVEVEFEVEVDMLNWRFGVVVIGRNEAVRNAGLRWVSSLSEVLFINAMDALRERTVKQRDVEEIGWLYILDAQSRPMSHVTSSGRSIDDQRITHTNHTHQVAT